MNPYDLGLWAPPWLWHISLPHWVYSILTPNSKDPQNSIYCRAGSVTGASSNGLCVGNTPARWWASVATQHYYVSNIIYGLIQCQLYNCIILMYLHLEKKSKSQWNFPLWRTSSAIKCRVHQGCVYSGSNWGSSRPWEQKPLNCFQVIPFLQVICILLS